jgi:hypothetical protein
MFGRRLFGIVDWTLDADEWIESREQWVLVESIRRLACILYLIDLLLQSDAKTPSKGNCDTFWNMPLPCYRELWQASSDEEWNMEYDNLRKSKRRKGITLGELLQLRQNSRLDEVVRTCGGCDIAEELSEWCEKADDLSMLLWMALTVEGEGQAPSRDVVKHGSTKQKITLG